jgi:putative SOS response-associated peptidase YedK
MCNLYATMKMRAENAALARAMRDRNNNQPPIPGVYPGYAAPIVARMPDGSREMFDAEWGLPSSQRAQMDLASKRADKLREKGQEVDQARFQELLRLEPDKGTTNVRNTASKHWARWLGPENRCLVPITSFCEPDQVGGSRENIWFALDENRPATFFAGVWVPQWTSARTLRDGPVTRDLFGFLTTEANAEVRAHHDKAMPVILTTEQERDLWLSDAPWPEVAHLQRPLPDGALKIVAKGVKRDEIIPA